MPVTGLSLFYLNGILQDVNSITQVDARIVESTRAIRSSLEAAAGTEIAFVLFGETSYLDQNRRLMDDIRRTSLADLSHLEMPDSGFDRIPGMAAQYEVTMARLADLHSAPPGSIRPLGDFEKALGALQDRLRTLRDRAMEEKDPQARRRFFEEMRKAADSLSTGMLESARDENPDRARLLDETSRIRERIDAIAEQVQQRAVAHIDAHRRHVVSLSNRAQRNLLTTIVLTGIVGVYLVLFLPSRVVRSLRRITHVLQQAERGDLDVSTLETGSDEVGSLAGHLNRVLRQARTFDDLKTERMLRAEQRLEILVENLEEGIVLVDDEMKPAFISLRARQLLDARPEGADDARVAGILAGDDFAAVLRKTIETQSPAEQRIISLDVGASAPRRLRVWADPVPGKNGEVKEILLLLRKAV
jgi:HAMP domain-containing protein